MGVIQYVCIHFFGTDMTMHSVANASYVITISRVVAFHFFKMDSQPLFNLEPLFIVTSIIMSKDTPEYGLPVKERA